MFTLQLSRSCWHVTCVISHAADYLNIQVFQFLVDQFWQVVRFVGIWSFYETESALLQSQAHVKKMTSQCMTTNWGPRIEGDCHISEWTMMKKFRLWTNCWMLQTECCSIPFSLAKKHDEGHSNYIGVFALGAKPPKRWEQYLGSYILVMFFSIIKWKYKNNVQEHKQKIQEIILWS